MKSVSWSLQLFLIKKFQDLTVALKQRSVEEAMKKHVSNDENLQHVAGVAGTQRGLSPSASVHTISFKEEREGVEDTERPRRSSSPFRISQSAGSDEYGLKRKLLRKRKTAAAKQEDDLGDQKNLKFWRRKLIILIWLNFIMRYRKKFPTIVQLFFPGLCFLVICAAMVINTTSMAQSPSKKVIPRDDPYHPLNRMSFSTVLAYACSNDQYCGDQSHLEPGTKHIVRHHFIVYAPNTTFINRLMMKAKIILEVDEKNLNTKFFGVATDEEMERIVKNQWNYAQFNGNKSFPVGIFFNFAGLSETEKEEIDAGTRLPRKLRYAIRTMDTETAISSENFPFVDNLNAESHVHEVSYYIRTGFAGLMLSVDLSFLEMVKDFALKDGSTIPPYVTSIQHVYDSYVRLPYVQMYKYPMFPRIHERTRTWTTVVLGILISYACAIYVTVFELGNEAETGKIELLKLHGLTPALHWIAYGINFAVINSLTSLFLALILHYEFADKSILPFDNTVIIYLFFFLHGVAQYVENLFFILFFENAQKAAVFAVFRSFASFLLPMSLFRGEILSRLPNLFLCMLIPQWCMANGIYSFLQYELYENGLEWYDFPVLIDTKEYILGSVPVCCIIFVYSIVIYLLLTIYCDRVLPKKYAPSVPWSYILTEKWKTPPEFQEPPPPINYKEMPQMYERPPTELKCTIKVRNLCKTFESEQTYEVSLDNINVDVFEGEILGIVGPAGSGKTNLLHLIAGLLNPTSGFVEMENMKVHEHSDFLNHYISICPQKCMLFPTLSVEDHVRLCCMVHGNSYRKSKLRARMLLHLFGLEGAKRHSYLWLSRTQIQKLQVAMALASNPIFLILDEPFQNVDPENTKQMWKYLNALKGNRTIILATTQIEDAEMYCDRILMLVNGQAVCYGTPNGIKRHYNIGSVLNIEEDGEIIPQTALEEIVSSEMKGALNLAPIGYEEGFRVKRILLPFSDHYAPLLEKIEDSKEALKYKNIWMSRAELGAMLHKISTSKGIESTFVKREDFEKHIPSDEDMRRRTAANNAQIPDAPITERSTVMSFIALFYKKWLDTTQSYTFVITEFTIPLLFLLMMALISFMFLGFRPESLNRVLNMDMYKRNLVLIKPRTSETEAQQKALYEAWRSSVGGQSHTKYLPYSVDIEREIKRRSSHTLTNFRQQVLAAIGRDSDITTGYYSATAYHSAPIVMNLMTNGILNLLTRDKRRFGPYTTSVSNHPIQQYEGFPAGSTKTNTTTIYAFVISMILALIAAAEMRLPVWEQTQGVKRLVRMAGASPAAYWISNALGDVIKNGLLVIVLMGIWDTTALYHQQMKGCAEKLLLAAIMTAYLCWTSIPYSYLISSMMKPRNPAYSIFLMLHFILGILPMAYTHQILRIVLTTPATILRFALHIFPPYSVTSALVHYFHLALDRGFCTRMSYDPKLKQTCNKYADIVNDENRRQERERLSEEIDTDGVLRHCCAAFCEPLACCHPTRSFFTTLDVPGLKVDLIAMAVQGAFYWVLLIMAENGGSARIYHCLKSAFVGDKEVKYARNDTRRIEEPEDVKKEHAKVDFMIDIEDNVESEVLLVQNLTKFYVSKKKLDHLYFTVPVYHVTGVWGPQKSGLSTLVKILIGKLLPSDGNIFMDNEQITRNNRTSVNMKIGYLPQENAYYPNLTGFQTLTLFGHLRGISAAELDVQVRRWLAVFDLESYAAMTAKSYRPGVLRRLCCAAAMIGNPPMVIFDEPTIDMDARERDIYWRAIQQATKKQYTIFLTTTLIEEARTCSDKIMIIDHGDILAVGTPQEALKESSPKGLYVFLKLNIQHFAKLTPYQADTTIDQIREHITRYLSPCDLLTDEGATITYYIKDLTTKLSTAYGVLEGATTRFPNAIENFLIGESSLDDFVSNFRKRRRSSDKGDEDSHSVVVFRE